MAFARGLGRDLRELFAKQEDNSWWNDIVQHRDLAIAIRDQYLNVYSNGQSLFRIFRRNDDIAGETHYKYLVDKGNPEYRLFQGKRFNVDNMQFIRDYGPNTLAKLVSNAKNF